METTKQKADRIVATFESRLNQTVPMLPKSFIRTLAWIIASVAILLEKKVNLIAREYFPQTASEEYLLLHAELNQITRASSFAELQVEIEGVAGSVYPIGSALLSGDGITYNTNQDVILGVDGKATVAILATESGEIGNLENGETLTQITNDPNISTITVIGTNTFGEVESIESFRERIVQRWRLAPNGGNYADYYLWATDVANVTDALVYSGTQAGTVEVFPLLSGVGANRIPTMAQIAEVEASIDMPDRRPVTADVYVLQAELQEFIVKVIDLGPNTTQAQQDAEQAITEYIGTRQPYIEGLSSRDNSLVSASQIVAILFSRGYTVSSVEIFSASNESLPLLPINIERGKIGSVTRVDIV